MKIHFGLVVGLALLLGACSRDSASQTPAAQTKSTNQSISGTMAEIMKLGDSFVCRTSVSGVEQLTYVKQGQIYAKTNFEGKAAEVITKDNCMWSWSAGEATGITMCFDPAEVDEASEDGVWKDTPGQLPEDLEFSCEKSDIDDNLFTPPADVNFTSMDQLLNVPKTPEGATPSVSLEEPFKQLSPEEQAELNKLMESVNQ